MRLISGYELWGGDRMSGQRVVRMEGRHIEASAYDMLTSSDVRVMHAGRVADISYEFFIDKGPYLLTAGLEDDAMHWYLWDPMKISTTLLGAWCEQDMEEVPEYVRKAHAMGVAAGYPQPVFVLLDVNKEPSYYID